MSKGMKASLILIGILLAAGVVFLGLRAIFAARETGASAAEESDAAGRGPMARLATPKNQADVLDTLAVAIQQNHNAVGWLEVPGTDINHVVMQGDDNDYYLRRNEDGEHDPYGCYFLDSQCTLGAREHFSPNTVIYGHSELTDNPDGKRFAQLFRFTDPEFAREHPYLYLSTQDGKYTFQIFAVMYTDVSFDYIQVQPSEDELRRLEQKAAELSIYDYAPTFAPGDHILTLSTCSIQYGSDGNQRFVVMGMLRPENFVEQEQASFTPRERRKPASSAPSEAPE